MRFLSRSRPVHQWLRRLRLQKALQDQAIAAEGLNRTLYQDKRSFEIVDRGGGERWEGHLRCIAAPFRCLGSSMQTTHRRARSLYILCTHERNHTAE